MKRILLFGALLMSALSANAQLLNATFEDDAMTGWRFADADGDSQNWSTSNLHTGHFAFEGKYAISFSWNEEGEYTPDNYLISPNVNIPQNGAVLTFKKGYGFYTDELGEAPDQLSVYIVPEGTTDQNIAQLTPVFNEVFNVYHEQPSLEEVTVNLNAYIGQAVSVVFRHHDSGIQEFVYIDTVVITENTASRNETKASQFKIYPNPAESFITIESNDNAVIQEVTITDIDGRLVHSEAFKGAGNASLNVSDLASGIYILKLSSDKGTITKKIVKN
jgi:hypothetical protein